MPNYPDYSSKDLARDIVKNRRKVPQSFTGPRDSHVNRKNTPRGTNSKELTYQPSLPRGSEDKNYKSILGNSETDVRKGIERGRADRNQVQTGKGKVNSQDTVKKGSARGFALVSPPLPDPYRPGKMYGWPTSGQTQKSNGKNKAV